MDGHVLEDPLIEYAFGFGMRKCPGRQFADATTWLYIASVLAVFDTRKAKGENGEEISVRLEYDPALSLVQYVHSLCRTPHSCAHLYSEPMPFACALMPRDHQMLEHILQQY